MPACLPVASFGLFLSRLRYPFYLCAWAGPKGCERQGAIKAEATPTFDSLNLILQLLDFIFQGEDILLSLGLGGGGLDDFGPLELEGPSQRLFPPGSLFLGFCPQFHAGVLAVSSAL